MAGSRSETGLAQRAAADARRLAWQVLAAVEQGAFADAALARRLRAESLEPRDRALAAQLVYGTLAWQGQLDAAIAQARRDPLRLDPPLRVLLRMALFQLVHLDRVPDFAAVDTAVELSKDLKGGAASGLVNAVLRRFLRAGKQIDIPPRPADLAGHLAIAYSHPRWVVEMWLAELGAAETEALLAADNTPAPTVLRVTPRGGGVERVCDACTARGIDARPTAYAPCGVRVVPSGDPAELPGYREGWFALQGEASQLVAALLGVGAGQQVLDLCAAPGGKTLAVAEGIGTGRVVAIDRHRRGLVHARREARRLGVSAVEWLQADAAAPPLAPRWRADAVLVDAPCSGLGTLRQHPEIRWRRTPRDVRDLSALQRRLLDVAAPYVARDGVLVYATCTIARAENAAVIEEFLAAHRDFARDDPRLHLPPAAHGLIDADGALRTFPHRDGLDGFFAVRLKRSASLRMVQP